MEIVSFNGNSQRNHSPLDGWTLGLALGILKPEERKK
jgi:hypothetical protein